MARDEPIRVVHVITGLETGGAECSLLALVRALGGDEFRCAVLSLTGGGAIGTELEAAGCEVVALNVRRGGGGAIRAFSTLQGYLRHTRPHVVQTWMYHSDLLGGLAARLVGPFPVVWNIRHAAPDGETLKRATRWVARVCGALSVVVPRRIVVCSEAALEAHARAGFARERMMVIPNGYDTGRFRPDEEARAAVRAELGISGNTVLIGLFGRFHAVKNHRGFIDAAARVCRRYPQVRFVMCGDGVDRENAQLSAWLRAAGVLERFHLLGRRSDMPRLSAALDIAVSASRSEGFPNVIGEAMACGVPCVVGDVGGGTELVGATGMVVRAADPAALARGMMALVAAGPEGRRRLGEAARRRIEERFSADGMAQRYAELYREMAQRCVGSRG